MFTIFTLGFLFSSFELRRIRGSAPSLNTLHRKCLMNATSNNCLIGSNCQRYEAKEKCSPLIQTSERRLQRSASSPILLPYFDANEATKSIRDSIVTLQPQAHFKSVTMLKPHKMNGCSLEDAMKDYGYITQKRTSRNNSRMKEVSARDAKSRSGIVIVATNEHTSTGYLDIQKDPTSLQKLVSCVHGISFNGLELSDPVVQLDSFIASRPNPNGDMF